MEHNKLRDTNLQIVHTASYDYFCKHLPNHAACQDFIQHCMQLCTTGDMVVRIDGKKQQCIIHEQDWQQKMVIWGSIKTPLYKALQEFILIYDIFLPSLKSQYPHGIEQLTTPLITCIMCDMTTLLDVYTEQTTKRGPKKYWEVISPYGTFSHYKAPQQNIVQEIKKDITSILEEDTKILQLTSMYDVIAYINRSTFPVRITPYGVMNITKATGLKISDLQSPHMYTFRHLDTQYTFDVLLKSCIAKWGNNIDNKSFIEENISKDLKNGAKSALYIAIIKNIKKLYLVQTGKHLLLQYDDGSSAKYDWEQTTISMILSKPQKITEQPASKQGIYYPGKKKILKNNPNDTIQISVDLRASLGYTKRFATTLQNFCERYIIKEKTSNPITILALAQYRMRISPAQIAEFFTQRNLKYCILALDHILENYLSDKHTSYKDRRQVSIASKQ